MGVFNSIKNNAIEYMLKKYIDKYGELKDFDIDFRAKRIDISVLLKGDETPIDLHILDYRFSESGTDTYAEILEANTSKEWLNNVLIDYIIGKKFLLPKELAPVIKIFL